MTRILSGIQTTSKPHLGNYLGALRQWAEAQHRGESLYMLADLHSLTIPQQPDELRAHSLELAAWLIAVGIDPEVSTIFAQSHVPAHAELGWILQCTASMGELRRMTQFKDKGGESESVSAGLFAYPCLMAADILLYDIDEVPVGEDQRQHLELTRDLAIRFNSRYGETFVVPKATLPPVATRVRDLQDPTRKMSKSLESPGTIWLEDSPDIIARKIKRAVTDADGTVAYDFETKPGVSNLLELLSAATGESPADLAGKYTQYGPLKSDTADEIVSLIQPLQERFGELMDDPSYVMGVLAAGSAYASEIAENTLGRSYTNIGLLRLHR